MASINFFLAYEYSTWQILRKFSNYLISRFLIYIQGGLGFLFLCLYLLRGMISFREEEEEQQREREYILYLLPYFHPYNCPSLTPFYCHINVHASVLILLISSCHSHYH